MKYFLASIILFTSLSVFTQTGDYPYSPVKFSDIQIQDAFWTPRQDTNRIVTIPFAGGDQAGGRLADNHPFRFSEIGRDRPFEELYYSW